LSVPYDPDFKALAQRVHAALMAQLKWLDDWCALIVLDNQQDVRSTSACT
jgi:hypothetical protein